MATSTHTIEVIIRSQDRATSSLSRISSALSRFGQTVTGTTTTTNRFNQLLQNTFSVAAGFIMARVIGDLTSRIASLARGLIDANATMELYEMQFSVLLDGMEEARERMEYLERFAIWTPFNLETVIEASRVLEIFGGSALATGENLEMVGNMASAAGRQFDEVALWVGRMYDALQSGRPIGLAAMALQRMGVLTGQARNQLEDMTAAGVSGTEAWEFFTDQMSRFGDLMRRQSQTYIGIVSNIEDTWLRLRRILGEPIFNRVRDILGDFLEWFSSAEVEAAARRFADQMDNVLFRVERVIAAVREGRDFAQAMQMWFDIDAERIRRVVDALEAIGRAIAVMAGARLAASAIGLLTSALNPLTAILTALSVAFYAWDQNLFGFRDTVMEVVSAIDRQFGPAIRRMADALRSGDLRRAVDEFGNLVADALEIVRARLEETFASLGQLDLGELLQGLGTRLGEIAAWIITEGIPMLAEGFAQLLPELGNVLGEIVRWLRFEFIPSVVSGIGAFLESLFRNVLESVINQQSQIQYYIEREWNRFWNVTLPNALRDAIATILREVQNLLRAIGDALGPLGLGGAFEDAARSVQWAIDDMERANRQAQDDFDRVWREEVPDAVKSGVNVAIDRFNALGHESAYAGREMAANTEYYAYQTVRAYDAIIDSVYDVTNAWRMLSGMNPLEKPVSNMTQTWQKFWGMIGQSPIGAVFSKLRDGAVNIWESFGRASDVANREAQKETKRTYEQMKEWRDEFDKWARQTGAFAGMEYTIAARTGDWETAMPSTITRVIQEALGTVEEIPGALYNQLFGTGGMIDKFAAIADISGPQREVYFKQMMGRLISMLDPYRQARLVSEAEEATKEQTRERLEAQLRLYELLDPENNAYAREIADLEARLRELDIQELMAQGATYNVAELNARLREATREEQLANMTVNPDYVYDTTGAVASPGSSMISEWQRIVEEWMESASALERQLMLMPEDVTAAWWNLQQAASGGTNYNLTIYTSASDENIIADYAYLESLAGVR